VVAGRRRPLHRVERREAVAQAVDLLVDRLLLDMGLAAPDLEALVRAELGRRPDADLDRERERLALTGEIADVELRLADGDDAGAVDRVDVPVRERFTQRLVEHRFAPQPPDHDRRWDLPLTEPGDTHLPSELARSLLDAALDLLGRHFGVDLDARLGELGDVGFHGCWRGHAPDDSFRRCSRGFLVA